MVAMMMAVVAVAIVMIVMRIHAGAMSHAALRPATRSALPRRGVWATAFADAPGRTMESSFDPAARDRAITGQPQRIAVPEGAALDPRALAAIETLRLMHRHPPQEQVHPFYATMALSPQAFASFLQLGSDLSGETALPPDLRELAVLRTGWRCGAPYQWGEHVRVARRIGLDDAAVARVREGPDAPGWSAIEAAVLRAADELHDGAMISDSTWAVLAAHLDARQLAELPLLIGHYHMTAYVQNALRIALNPGNPGLSGP